MDENILIIVKKLTKSKLYKPITKIEIKIISKILKRQIFSICDLSNLIVHDKNTQWIVSFSKRIYQQYDKKLKSFSAYSF